MRNYVPEAAIMSSASSLYISCRRLGSSIYTCCQDSFPPVIHLHASGMIYNRWISG